VRSRTFGVTLKLSYKLQAPRTASSFHLIFILADT